MILMIVGTFGDNILRLHGQIIEYGSIALVVVGFALAYDGVERTRK